MHPALTYQYFGLLAFCVLLCGLTFIIWKWPQGKHLSFSQHVAVHQHRILYYILLFSITLPLLLLFFVGWFTPTLNLPVWFNVFLVLSALTQYACTLIPEVGGWKTTYHRLLAGISALSLMPPLLLLFLASNVAATGKTLALIGLATMGSVIYLLAAGKGKHSHFLYLQISYYAAFFMPVLYISYLR